MKNEITIKVTWGDCDLAGIVFYPNFLRWFDSGTENLLEAAGASYQVLRNEYGLLGLPLVNVRCDFRSPARLGDTVRVESSVERLGSKSLVIAHRAWIGAGLCAEGFETRVAVQRQKEGELATLTTVAIPHSVRVKLSNSARQ